MLTLHGSQGPRRGPDLKELGIIHDGAVLVRDGLVRQVGTTRRVENLAEARDAVEVSATGRVVMPGFIDSHTHLAGPPPCAGADELEKAARRIRTSSTKRLMARLRTQLEAMVRHGTTTVAIETSGSLDETVGVKLLRTVAGLRNNPLDAFSSFLLDATACEAAMSASESLLPKIAKRRLARFACIGLNGDEARRTIAQRFLHAAAEAGLPLKVEIDGDGLAGGMALVNGYNIVSVEHAERAAEEDVQALANFPGVATVLPSGSFAASGTACNLRALADNGAAIALASNFHPKHRPALNMQAVIGLACLEAGLTPEEAISAATINGAHALGCADVTGSLEIGKQADLLVLNAADYRDLGSQFGANLVHLTMKGGAFIYKEGDVTRLTADDLRPRR